MAKIQEETRTCDVCGNDVTQECRSLFAVGAARMASYRWLCAACTGAVQDFLARHEVEVAARLAETKGSR